MSRMRKYYIETSHLLDFLTEKRNFHYLHALSSVEKIMRIYDNVEFRKKYHILEHHRNWFFERLISNGMEYFTMLLKNDIITCANCGVENVCPNYSFGLDDYGKDVFDMELRNKGMFRSSLYEGNKVYVCHTCNYCSHDITKINSEISVILKSKEYLDQLENYRYQYMTNVFLCKAMINKKIELYANAVWDYLHAAWICDDKEYGKQAYACRVKAINMILLANKNKQSLFKDSKNDSYTILILVELLRRTNQLITAKKIIKANYDTILKEDILKALDLQLELIKSEDTDYHIFDKLEITSKDERNNQSIVIPKDIYLF